MLEGKMNDRRARLSHWSVKIVLLAKLLQNEVHIFWEGHNILQISIVALTKKNLQNFVAFSEYINFNWVNFHTDGKNKVAYFCA